MKVIFEALRLPRYGGVRSAAIGWIKALAEFSDRTHFIALLSQPESELQYLTNLKQIIIPTATRSLPRLYLQFLLPILVQKHKADIVHFLRNLAVVVPNAQVVVNINDLNRFYLPDAYSKWDIIYWKIIQTRILKYSKRIICISNQTRRDVLNWLDYPEQNTITIFPAVKASFHPTINNSNLVKNKYHLYHKFVLYTGGLAKHKNVQTLIRAFGILKQSTGLPHQLVIVGGQYHTHVDTQAYTVAKELLKDDIIFTGPVPEVDLLQLYNVAELFVFPSLYEGFGLTPLEAMACGTPVIASPVGSLPEVLGDAAFWVENPLNEYGFASAMKTLLVDDDLRENLRQKGIEQASKFSWKKTAQQTMAVYEDLLT